MGTTILLVDDDIGARRTLASLLQRFGFRVVEAEDGQEALITAKTLVICGADDPIVPTVWGAHLATEFQAGWYATVPGPHATMFAAPAKIAALIDEHAHR